MKTKLFFLLVLLLATIQTSIAFQEKQDHEVLFEKAMYTMETKADLKEAISLFELLINTYPNEKEYVAKALFYEGMCYEKLGNIEARKYYEKVINDYSDQSELVQLAQISLKRVLTLEKPTDVQLASVLPEDLTIINLYDKGSSVIKGTMVENSSLSPDGTKIVGVDYSDGQNIAVYDRLSKQIQKITQYEWLTEPVGWTYYPSWSPDGKEIVYMFSDYNNYELQVSTLEGKTRTLLRNESNAGQIIPRQWSQDGCNILTFKQDSSGFYTIGLVSAKEGSFKVLHKTQWKSELIEGNASLSPDGKFVVFSDGQKDKLDLFIIDTEGGTATILSDHPTNELDPLWSPDGKHIVFIRETKGGSFLYAIEMTEGKPAGSPFLIREGMQDVNLANWTENGIHYNLWVDIHDIHTLPLNPETGIPSGEPKPLDYTPTGSNISPVWSHDGEYLAFVSYEDKHEVVILPVDGGETRHYSIPNPEEFWNLSVSGLRWLPDNSGVSLTAEGSMGNSSAYRLDLITGKWQNWILPMHGWTSMDWGPDENSFVYAGWTHIDTDVNAVDPGLHQFNVITGETRNIFQPEPAEWYTFRGLKFSRDYKKLTYIFQDSKLMVLDLESGESRMLAEKYWSPTFSPDGKKILSFGPYEDAKTTGIIVFSLDGEILHQYDIAQHFTSGTRISQSDWSPDGKQLVFITRDMKYKTYLMKNVLK